MTEQKNQHFVPKFLLKRWADESGKVLAWRRENGEVCCDPVLPKNAAVHGRLYTRAGSTPEDRTRIETKFFNEKIENPAAQAIKRIIDDGHDIGDEDRITLARFMVAQFVRRPEVVKKVRDDGKVLIENELAAADPEFDRLKGTSSAKNLLEWVNTYDPTIIENFGIDMIPKIASDKEIIKKILRMHWLTLSAPEKSFEVIISDNPLVVFHGIDHSSHLQAFALDPRFLLFVSPSAEVIKSIQSRKPREIVAKFNKSVVSQATRFAYGRGERRFFDKHLPP